MLVPTMTARAPAAARATLAALLGLAALAVAGGIFLPHAILTGVRPVDIAGLVLVPVGLALLAVAARTALRGRRLWVKIVVIAAAVVITLQWWVLPVVTAGLATNAPRPAVATASTLGLPGARDVSFGASDGVRLAGWYVPGRNGTAVVLAHGSHGDRSDTLAHLRLLAGAGYGVLAYDARGHGESSGATNAAGWQGREDVAGAAAFLRRQAGVERVAALGLSMGAEEALRAAAGGVALDAVVADGAGASTLGDQRLVSGGPVAASVGWLTMRGVELLGGGDEPPALADVAGQIRAPVLLIASGAHDEHEIGEIYRGRIGARASVWFVGDAAHTKALERHPAAYAARVLGFLHQAG
jgi:dienelactone hydrolase